MKLRKLFLIILIFLIPLCAFAQDNIYKVIDFNKPSDPVAADILYNYALDKNKQYPMAYNDIKEAGTESIRAYRADLNGDDVDEVIGINYSRLFMGSHGGSLFILQKKSKGGYQELSPTMLYTHGMTIKIFNEKRNGYKKMLTTGEYRERDKSKNVRTKAEFTGKYYEFIFD